MPTAGTSVTLIAVLAAASGAAHAEPAARYAPKGMPRVGQKPGAVRPLDATDYLYVTYNQFVTAHPFGAGAMVLQADPALAPDDFHSLAEIAVESEDTRQIVELGWTIDKSVNNDLQPHVFVFHWVDGAQTCYNACDWVQVSPDKAPGMRVVPGEVHRYEILQVNGDWWMLYDGEAMGYFPGSLWSGRFTRAGLVQWFGEVAAKTTSPCTQMGNGKPGADAASAAFTELHLFDANGVKAAAAADAGEVTAPAVYSLGRTTATSFGFGGPGAVTGCCTPSSCGVLAAQCGTIADPVCADNMLVCGACDGEACSADHTCPSGIGPRDIGEQFDVPVSHSGGGCCGAGASGPSALVLAALVGGLIRRQRFRGDRGARWRLVE